MYKKLKQWWDNIKTFIQKQRQLHREEVNIKDSLIASAEESKKQSEDSFLLKKEELKQIKKDVKEQKHQLKQGKKILKQAKKKKGFWTTVFVIFVCTVAALLFFSVQWVFRTWPNLKMD